MIWLRWQFHCTWQKCQHVLNINKRCPGLLRLHVTTTWFESLSCKSVHLRCMVCRIGSSCVDWYDEMRELPGSGELSRAGCWRPWGWCRWWRWRRCRWSTLRLTPISSQPDRLTPRFAVDLFGVQIESSVHAGRAGKKRRISSIVRKSSVARLRS